MAALKLGKVRSDPQVAPAQLAASMMKVGLDCGATFAAAASPP